MRLVRRFAQILILVSLIGCSLKKRAVDTFVDVLGEAEGVYLSEDDPELPLAASVAKAASVCASCARPPACAWACPAAPICASPTTTRPSVRSVMGAAW